MEILFHDAKFKLLQYISSSRTTQSIWHRKNMNILFFSNRNCGCNFLQSTKCGYNSRVATIILKFSDRNNAIKYDILTS